LAKIANHILGHPSFIFPPPRARGSVWIFGVRPQPGPLMVSAEAEKFQGMGGRHSEQMPKFVFRRIHSGSLSLSQLFGVHLSGQFGALVH
jgi:hypothetical protein